MKIIIIVIIFLIIGCHMADTLSTSNDSNVNPNAIHAPEAVTEVIDGSTICDETGEKQHDDSLKEMFDQNSTIRDVVSILGLDYCLLFSSSGVISWTCTDGSFISSPPLPQELNDKVTLHYK